MSANPNLIEYQEYVETDISPITIEQINNPETFIKEGLFSGIFGVMGKNYYPYFAGLKIEGAVCSFFFKMKFGAQIKTMIFKVGCDTNIYESVPNILAKFEEKIIEANKSVKTGVYPSLNGLKAEAPPFVPKQNQQLAITDPKVFQDQKKKNPTKSKKKKKKNKKKSSKEESSDSSSSSSDDGKDKKASSSSETESEEGDSATKDGKNKKNKKEKSVPSAPPSNSKKREGRTAERTRAPPPPYSEDDETIHVVPRSLSRNRKKATLKFVNQEGQVTKVGLKGDLELNSVAKLIVSKRDRSTEDHEQRFSDSCDMSEEITRKTVKNKNTGISKCSEVRSIMRNNNTSGLKRNSLVNNTLEDSNRIGNMFSGGINYDDYD